MTVMLITGGNGFLGRNLVAALLERGDEVRVLAFPGEDTTWLQEQRVKIFRGDIRDRGILTAPMRGVDGVFHLAGMIGAWRPMRDYYAVNVTGTRNVCQGALAAGVHRVVHVSSAMAYNMAAGRPATESDLLEPLDEPYSLTKAQGDRLVQRMVAEDRLPAVIVRPATLFGPGDRLNFGRIADRVRGRRAIIIGSGDNAVPFVYIDDVVQGLLLAMTQPNALGQIYNIASDQPCTQETLLSSIAQDIGAPPPRIHVPYNLLYRAALAAECIATLSGYRVPPLATRHGVKLYGANNLVSIDKARGELGFAPQMSWREGVRLAAAWYVRQAPRASGDKPAGALVNTRR